jgi:hypothetical protein
MYRLVLAVLVLLGGSVKSIADPTGRGVSPELKARVVKLAKSCVQKAPDRYPSVWGSPLEFDKSDVHVRTEPDVMYIKIPEKAPKGKPQGVALEVNLKTGQCTLLRQD